MPCSSKDTTSRKQRIFGPFHCQSLYAGHKREEKPLLTPLLSTLCVTLTVLFLWFVRLEINRELPQLKEVGLLFCLGLMSISFILPLYLCSKLLLLFRAPYLTFHSLLVLLCSWFLLSLHCTLFFPCLCFSTYSSLFYGSLCCTFLQSPASLTLTTADDLEEGFHPHIYLCYCFQFLCHVTSHGCRGPFQASEQPRKDSEGWGCFSCLDELLSAEPERSCNHVTGNIDNPHTALLSSEHSVFFSFSKKQKVIPGKTRREEWS